MPAPHRRANRPRRDELLTSKIRPGRITDRYDDLLRVAGSLKRGWVPASLISRMQAASPKPPLAAALAAYGRLVRTNFLLAYLADAPLRRRIGAQLNKGETMHTLRRHVAFGQRQQLPADEDDHPRHALCLEVVTDAIVAWNARYLTAALDEVAPINPSCCATTPSRNSALSGTHTSTRLSGPARSARPQR